MNKASEIIDEYVEKILGRKIKPGLLQFFRYLICGGMATVTDAAILFVLVHFLGVHYLFAAALAFLSGIIVNYTMNTILVFKSSGQVKREFPIFALIGIGGLLWTELILWLFVDKLDIYFMISKFVAIVLVLNWNFFMRKKFVFSESKTVDLPERKRELKILTITATPFFSDRGCHMRIYNEAKFLKKFGADVKICAYAEGKNIEGFDIERIKKSRWYKRTAPGFSWGKFWLDIKLIFLCRKLIKSFRPDVIHAHLYEGLGIGYVAQKLAFTRIPLVFDLQGDLDEEFRSYNRESVVARPMFVWLSKKLIGRCDWLVLSSENMIPRIEKLFTRRDRILTIKDGVDLDLFRNIPDLAEGEREKIEKIIRWKGDKKMLAYVGGLSDNKGVGEMLEAFRKLAAGSGDWKLLVGGFGSDEEKYRKFVEEHNLQEHVHMPGKVEYFFLPAYMALADAAIDPKNESSESSGKLVNLMATRLPIICFDNPFNRARLGQKGYFMKNFDELPQVLTRINGKEKIEYDLANVSERKEVEKLLNVFERLKK